MTLAKPSCQCYKIKRIIESLSTTVQEYCLVSQDKCRVQKYTRQANTQDWLLSQYGRDDSIRFDCVEGDISLADLYAGVRR